MGVPITAHPTHLSPDRMGAEIAAHLDHLPQACNAIFAATDAVAVACLHELRKRGVTLPDAMRLIGFDDLPIAGQTVPRLTTIRQDIAAGARAMVDLLLRRLAGEDTESRVMPPRLIVRETA
jgi:DNA-binding LacI/PurR family transcriptional regulator